MKALKSILRTATAFILGVSLACGISPAVADITYQAASFLSSRVDALGTAINFYVSGTGIASIEAGGILPFTDGNNSISNLGASNRGYKNIYLSDGTNRSSLIQSNGLYIAGPSGQSIIFRNASTDVWSISSAGVLTSVTGNGGDLIFANTGTGVQYPITTSISAAGTTQSDATALSNTINHVGTVTAGTGVKLDAATQGKFRVIANFGANTLNLYPASGDALNNNAADAALTIASKKVAWCYALNTTDWIVIIGS